MVIEGEGEYKYHLEQDIKNKDTLYDILKGYENRSEKEYIEQRKRLLKEFAGINLKEVIWVADDWGDELLNPIDFAADASDFAKICKANQLANKLKPLSNKAAWLSARINI